MAKLELSEVYPEPVVMNHDVFVVTRNSDLTEGRGGNLTEGYYDDLDEAIAAARGISTQGSDGDVYRLVEINPDKKVMYWGRRYDWDAHRNIYGFTEESGR